MTKEKDSFGFQTEGRIFHARLLILCERLLLLCWKPFLVLSVFIVLSLLDVWQLTDPLLHGLALIALLAALIWFLIRDGRNFQFARRADALQRLEENNNLSHRPLRSYNHHLADFPGADEQSQALWAVHKQRLGHRLEGLKPGRLRPVLPVTDGYAVRSLAILLLVTGLVVSGPAAGTRILDGALPDFISTAIPLEIDAWFDPPDYTNIAPLTLSRDGVPVDQDAPAPLHVPVGSRFVAQIFGGNDEVPILMLDQQSHEFLKIDSHNFQLELDITAGSELSVVKDGDNVARWRLNIIADDIPTIALLAEPEITHRSAFRLRYQAADDYGVKKIGAEFRLEDQDRKLEIELPLLRAGARVFEGQSYQDMTAHPWAGLPVRMTLYAEDHIKQRGYSKIVQMVLPERTFLHPLAKALIEQRKKLVIDADAYKSGVVIALGALMTLPEGLNNDATIMMGLAFSRSSLIHGRTEKSVSTVIDMLWHLALKLENGDLSLAEIALREAERKLMDALNNNASDAEISQLVDELRRAMNKYLEAMVNAGELPPDTEERRQGDENVIRADELQKMLDKIDKFSKLGSRDAARELLSELQDILENLQRQAGRAPTAGEQQAQKMMREMGDLMRRQQELLDETFRRSQRQSRDNMGQSQQGDGKSSRLSDLAGQQEALRQMLGEMMGRLGMQGEIPSAMGRAERKMNEARQSLQQGDGKNAAEAESGAMDQLRQSAEQMAEQMGGQAEDGQGQAGGRSQAGRDGRDPLGRDDGSGTNRMNQGRDMLSGLDNQLHKTQKLRDEMHRRLSDPKRPKLERDYLKRLLKRF